MENRISSVSVVADTRMFQSHPGRVKASARPVTVIAFNMALLGVASKTVSSKSALHINHDSHQVPVSIVLTLASLMLCALAWVTDLPEALLITSSSIRKLPDTAAITLLPVRFFDAVNACHAPGAILHPLVMIATPHAVPGLRHHRRIQPIDEAA